MELKKLGELDRSNLANEIAIYLRELIVSGEITPGTRIVEADFASQLGVSRGSLREALRILETERLLESFPGRGSFVVQTSKRDIQELYSLRCILEEEAMRLAINNGTENDFDRLQLTVESMLKAAKEQRQREVMELDYRFHCQIWEIADHILLMKVLESITIQMRMYLAVQTQLYEDLAEGVLDHQLILQALRNSEKETAVQLLKNHLELAAQVVLSYFETSETHLPEQIESSSQSL
jgi:DNA-binding GntR family transcriptional regulator